MSLKYVLFDLDGTLVDTFCGVTTSVAYSLNKFGIRVDDLESLRPFICADNEPCGHACMSIWRLSRQLEKLAKRVSHSWSAT